MSVSRLSGHLISVSNSGDPAQVTSHESTFIALYETHYDEVHAFCARRVGWHDAGDVTAEAFAVAWRRIADLPSDQPRAWVFGVARSIICNQWRSTARRRRLAERVKHLRHAPADEPEGIVIRKSVDAEVLEALGQMRGADREILQLAAWDELSGPEIAAVLGIALPAVQQRISRAKKRLARQLQSEPVSNISEEAR